MEHTKINPITKVFVQAIESKNFEKIGSLLKDEVEEFEVQDSAGDKLKVDKNLYIKWLTPKLETNDIQDIRFDKCNGCAVGNEVMLINYGSFPYINNTNDESVFTGLMLEVENDKIAAIKFCTSLEKTQLKYRFECKASQIRWHMYHANTYEQAYENCVKNNQWEFPFTYYKQTERGIEFKTIRGLDREHNGIIGEEPTTKVYGEISEEFRTLFLDANWLRTFCEYNIRPRYKKVKLKFDLNTLSSNEKDLVSMKINEELPYYIYIFGFGLMKNDYIDIETKYDFSAFEMNDGVYCANIETPDFEGINQLVQDRFAKLYPNTVVSITS
jgi:hypothetical protein